MERNIKLTIAYDGTSYVGWQRQPINQGMSIQQKVEDTLTKLMGHKVVIHGAGRTDAGVHACGQVANFTCDKPLPTKRLAEVINHFLPSDISVVEAVEVPAHFHSRKTTHTKRYRYVIEQGKRVSPFANNYSWQLDGPLDIEAMEKGAKLLLGEHDFRHFTLTKSSVKNYVRTIYSIDIKPIEPIKEPNFIWQEMNNPLVIEVTGNGFLYKMVRLIVGRLVAVGQGRMPYQAIDDFLAGDKPKNIPPAPAQGLFLDKICYQEKA